MVPSWQVFLLVIKIISDLLYYLAREIRRYLNRNQHHHQQQSGSLNGSPLMMTTSSHRDSPVSESPVVHKQRQQQRRYSPYERPLQNELNKPIKNTKTTKTIIEIDKPHDYFDRKLAEKALAYMTYDQYNDDEDKSMVEVKIEKEEVENKV